MSSGPSARPLDGINVVEFGNLVAAPYCGMLLADLGAAVVKVEPLSGDLARHLGPEVGGESSLFIALNRGKRGIAVDTKHPDVRPVLSSLCQRADVVIHNLAGQAMERMGLGFDDVSRTNPGVVYAAISAFGAEGPFAGRPGIDLVFQGESGMMSITGGQGEPPHKTATTIADFVAGTNAALGVCAALYERTRVGHGRNVDVSLRDGLIAVQAGWNSIFFATGSQPERTGTASPISAPNQTLETADRHINLAIVSDRHFASLADLLGRAELASDPRFASNRDRTVNRDELLAELTPLFKARPASAWMEELRTAGIPAGLIMDLAEVFDDPQVVHNQMVVELEHPRAGTVRVTGSPIRVDGEPAMANMPPPWLGQHTHEVLSELGVGEDIIGRLRSERAIAG